MCYAKTYPALINWSSGVLSVAHIYIYYVCSTFLEVDHYMYAINMAVYGNQLHGQRIATSHLEAAI